MLIEMVNTQPLKNWMISLRKLKPYLIYSGYLSTMPKRMYERRSEKSASTVEKPLVKTGQVQLGVEHHHNPDTDHRLNADLHLEGDHHLRDIDLLCRVGLLCRADLLCRVDLHPGVAYRRVIDPHSYDVFHHEGDPLDLLHHLGADHQPPSLHRHIDVALHLLLPRHPDADRQVW